MIPDYDVVVVDEAHEVVSRVTQAATDELFAAEVDRAARRSRRWVTEGEKESSPADDLADAGDALAAAIGDCEPGRFDTVPEALADALVLVRDAARACLSAYPKEGDAGRRRRRRRPHPGAGRGAGGVRHHRADGGALRGRRALADRGRRPAAAAAVRRAAGGLGPDARQAARRQDRGDDLGDADARRRLRRGGHLGRPQAGRAGRGGGRGHGAALPAPRSVERAETTPSTLPWVGLDVGSPFDYGRQAILYVARHLPPPGRDGLGPAQLDEIVSLVDAADGRTLGLFSSRRAAETAAEAVRERLPHLTTLAQGDAQLPELARQFVERPPHLPVRHAQPVAGPRRARRHLPAGAHRPDPVPAARRPADERAPARRRPRGAQRLHAGRRHPRRAAAGPGLRPADPHHDRQGRGRDPRPAAGHRPLRLVPAGQPAADVDDVRRRPGAPGARRGSRRRKPPTDQGQSSSS